MPPQLVLSASNAATLLGRIARSDHPDRQHAYWSITRLWLGPERTHVTYTPDDEDREVLEKVKMPEGVITSHRFVAVYRDPKSKAQVIVKTNDQPRKKKTLRTSTGKRRFVRVAFQDQLKESTAMAKTAKASKNKKSAKDEVEDELEDELEGLEEIDDDEDVEDEDVDSDEDDDDEDEDDESEDYESMTNADLKKLCKKRGIKGIDKANKAKLVGLLEAADAEGDDEDEDDDEEDDDESPLDGLDRAELKAYNKENDLGVAVKKSMSDDDLREALQAAIDESDEDEDEDDDEEEDDEPAPKKGKGKTASKSTAKKGGAKKGTPPPRRELPKGRLSANDVADMAGTNGLAVRNYLRSDEGRELFSKDEELGRYSFNKKEAAALVKKLKGRKGSKAAKASK